MKETPRTTSDRRSQVKKVPKALLIIPAAIAVSAATTIIGLVGLAAGSIRCGWYCLRRRVGKSSPGEGEETLNYRPVSYSKQYKHVSPEASGNVCTPATADGQMLSTTDLQPDTCGKLSPVLQPTPRKEENHKVAQHNISE